jgi:hypothetical protein
VTQPRAADDFATIRARLQALHRERAEATLAENARTEGLEPLRDTEKRSKDRRDGSPPPWVPTIFVKRLVGP